MRKHTVGLALGSLFGLMHIAWLLAVSGGYGDALIGWVETFHFLSNIGQVSGAEMTANTVVIGVLGAAASGYVVGWVFGWLWNFFAGVKQK